MRALPAAVLLLLVTGAFVGGRFHAVPQVQQFLEMEKGKLTFFDFRLFNSIVVEHESGSPLYRLERPGFYEPGSAVYKYPPPYAALISLSADVKWRPVARRFLALDSLCLLFAWGVFSADAILRGRKGDPGQRWWDPGGPIGRSLGLLAIVVLWKPFYESLAGIQLEPLFVLFFTLALIGLERGWAWLEGIAIGIAAVFKIYPAFLGLGVVVERRWRSVLAGALAALALVVFGAARFSWGETGFYFTKVLPKLGGTSTMLENLSVSGQIGNLLVHGYSPPRLDVRSSVATLETLGDPTSIWATRIVATLVGAALILITWRTLRTVASERRSPVRFALSIPLLLILMPTSWFDYQTLLFVPAAWLFLRLPFERRFLGTWVLLALSMLPLLLLDANRALGKAQPWISATRALASLGLWGAILLAVRASGVWLIRSHGSAGRGGAQIR